MAEQLLAPGRRLLTIARNADPALADLAVTSGAELIAWTLDLSDAVAAADRLQQWLAAQPPQDAALINNAAALSSPAPLRDSALAELSTAMRVGAEAPLLLTAAFLRATAAWATDRRVLNISSGLGRRAMAGSAGYCALKASMDHFSRAVALEEASRAHPVRIVSLAPGIIDTDMQVQLRTADPKAFPEQARFAELKASGQLDTPAQAAQKVLAYLARPNFGTKPVADVRDED